VQSSWFWASDPILKRVSLTDYSADRVVASIDGGWGITVPLFAENGAEFYLPETHYSRGSRGERTDMVTFYETKTFKPVAEVIIPPKRAHNALPIGNAALSDDGSFIAVFNMVPAQSISIVDTQRRIFVEEISTPGCSLVYGAGRQRFMLICGDGALMFVTLNDDGTLQNIQRTAKQFDPVADPVTEKAVRVENVWYFVSYEGYVHSVDVSQPLPNIAPQWSLLTDTERDNLWRIGGRQLLAVHGANHTLYVLMHQGDKDTHKQGGTHLWTFDLFSHKKLGETALLSPGFTFSGVSTEFGADWIWPFNNIYNWLTQLSFIEPLARPDAIVVTQDKNPTLLLGGQFTGMVAIYDAATLQFIKRATTGNLANLVLLPNAWSATTP
jgi:methylamine dehydrogenase heavy chain